MMKKIVIVAQGLNGGGAERVASLLANFLSKKHIVKYICVYNDKQEYDLSSNIEISHIKTNYKSSLLRLLDRNIKIFTKIRSIKPNNIISFVTNELLITQLFGYGVIHSLRNDPNNVDSSFIKKNIRNFLYSKANCVVFQTTGAKSYFNSKIQNKGIIINNPINTKILPKWESKNHNKSFITASRLYPQKNINMMIDSFYYLHKSYPEYSLEIYGDGALKEELNNRIIEMHAEDYIFLKGHVTNVHEIMSESFAFILSSDYEGLSNSMLEALAVGMPCICTDCPPGGAKSFITNGKNGFLVNVGNTKELTEKMKLLIENPGFADFFNKANHCLRDKLDAENICNEWEQLL